MPTNEPFLNQRYNLFGRAVGSCSDACLILRQDLQVLLILCFISGDLTVLADCQPPANSSTLTHKLNPVII